MDTEKQEGRPKCKWKIAEKLASGGTGSRECGSEEQVYSVKGQGRWTNRPRETEVCKQHLGDAWKQWKVDSADPVELPKRTTG